MILLQTPPHLLLLTEEHYHFWYYFGTLFSEQSVLQREMHQEF